MATLFHKYEGLGNDFILVELPYQGMLSTAELPRACDRHFAVRACDRHFGIGADGVLVVLPPADVANDARLRIVNADGTVPEMCGNGIRCVAVHLARARGMGEGVLRIETDAGLRACEVDDTARQGLVSVDMGTVRVLGERAVDVEGQSVTVTLADAGNPHAVLVGSFARADVERLGARLATHPAFPGGINAEFAAVAKDGAIDVVVWERGVGITLACGTGALRDGGGGVLEGARAARGSRWWCACREGRWT